MTRFCAVLLLVAYSSPAFAQQTPSGDQSASAANLVALSQSVSTLRRASQLDAAALKGIDEILAAAVALNESGNGSEARRKLAQAATLLAGQEWNAQREFASSLVFRADKIIADSLLPISGRLEQVYGARAPSDQGQLKLTLKLVPSTPLPNIQPVSDQPEPAPANAGQPPRVAGTALVFSTDLLEQPASVAFPVENLADGPYRLTVEVTGGTAGTALCQLTTSDVQLVAGIESKRPALETRLAKISGHEGTKASVRYPFDLARVVNSGVRPWESFYFPAPYNFDAGLKRAEELASELEAGRDPLWKAKGDLRKHYLFAAAGEIMPYRMHVPTSWDGVSALPMILVLHGNTKDQDYYLDRDNGLLRQLAEKHGYLVVTPFGYHPNGGWRAAEAGGGGRGGNRGNARGGRGGGGAADGSGNGFAAFRAGADLRRGRLGTLSEQDGINVLDLVMAEYPVDAKRVYLFGHSSGGAGTYHYAQKFAERWAGVAVSSGNVNSQTYPFDRIREMPFIIVHGSLDNEVRPEQSRNFAAALTAQKIAHEFHEYPEGTHASIVSNALPRVFDFFNTHNRHQPR